MKEEIDKLKRELQEIMNKLAPREWEIADLKVRIEQELQVSNDFKKETNNLTGKVNERD